MIPAALTVRGAAQSRCAGVAFGPGPRPTPRGGARRRRGRGPVALQPGVAVSTAGAGQFREASPAALQPTLRQVGPWSAPRSASTGGGAGGGGCEAAAGAPARLSLLLFLSIAPSACTGRWFCLTCSLPRASAAGSRARARAVVPDRSPVHRQARAPGEPRAVQQVPRGGTSAVWSISSGLREVVLWLGGCFGCLGRQVERAQYVTRDNLAATCDEIEALLPSAIFCSLDLEMTSLKGPAEMSGSASDGAPRASRESMTARSPCPCSR